ncbi:hypothetical protein ACMAZF_07420 [Psychrobium sp. nBUS_13]|uniref:hypothetical protein n=1 Tax=Psychrobium sp. nBUS_13 TaxID=3395319 RepID=UPI003EBDB8CA
MKYEKVYLDCEIKCTNTKDLIAGFLQTEYLKSFATEKTLFILREDGIEIDSITYRDFIQQFNNSNKHQSVKNSAYLSKKKPRYEAKRRYDGALACENDRDYDCEAWDDWP